MIRTEFDIPITKIASWGDIFHEILVVRYATPQFIAEEEIISHIISQLQMCVTATGGLPSSRDYFTTLAALDIKDIKVSQLSCGWYCYQILFYTNRENNSQIDGKRFMKGLAYIQLNEFKLKPLHGDDTIHNIYPFAMTASHGDISGMIVNDKYNEYIVSHIDEYSNRALEDMLLGEQCVTYGLYTDVTKVCKNRQIKIKLKCKVFDSYEEGLKLKESDGLNLVTLSCANASRPTLHFYIFNNDPQNNLRWFPQRVEKYIEIKQGILFTSDSIYGLEEIEEYIDLFQEHGFRLVRNIIHHSVKVSDQFSGWGMYGSSNIYGGAVTFLGFPKNCINFSSIRLDVDYQYEDFGFLVKTKNSRFPWVARTCASSRTDRIKPMIQNKSYSVQFVYPTEEGKMPERIMEFFRTYCETGFNRMNSAELMYEMGQYFMSMAPIAQPIQESDDDILVKWFDANARTSSSTDNHIMRMFMKQKEQLIQQYRQMGKYLKNFDFSNCRPVPALTLDKKAKSKGRKTLVVEPEQENINQIMGMTIAPTTNITLKGQLNLIDKKRKRIIHRVFDIESYYDTNKNTYELKYNTLKRGKKKC